MRPFDAAIRLTEAKIDDILRKYINPRKAETKNLVHNLGLFEMVGVFYLLGGGLLTSLIVFFFEFKRVIKY